MIAIICFVAIALIFSVLIPVVPSRAKGIAMVAGVLANSVLSGFVAIKVLMGQTFSFSFGGNLVSGPVTIAVDGLSAWFIIMASVVFVAASFYAKEYLKSYRTTSAMLSLHYVAMVLLHTAIIGVLTVQNGFVFLIFWEIMALSAFFAMMFEHTKMATHKAGLNYLVQSHLSLVLLMIGFMWVAVGAGSFSFDAMRQFTGSLHPWVSAALFIIFFTGFGIKAGFVPLHTWLPHAHPAAPSHMSAIMSGLVVKTGIYGIIRMSQLVSSDFVLLGGFVLLVSMSGGVFGILNAALHRDIKRMLAYCTVENIGIIGMGIGLGMLGMGIGSSPLYYLGFGGALFHALNHALFKPLLFFATGAVYRQKHTRDMDQLGGLVKLMPQTSAAFIVGSLAICGLPPFSGFVSEVMVYFAMIAGIKGNSLLLSVAMVVSIGGLALIGGLSLLTFTKTIGAAFLGTPRQISHSSVNEVPFAMLWPQYLLMSVIVVVSVFPFFVMDVAFGILSNGYHQKFTVGFNIQEEFGFLHQISMAGFWALAVVLSVWIIRRWSMSKWPQTVAPTWGCGYVGPSSKLQYTGKSFTKTLGKTFGFVIVEQKHYRELNPSEIFPQGRGYLSHYIDFFEQKIVWPLTNNLLHGANNMKFIQNGKVQSYVLYGIIFILTVFVMTYFSSVWESITAIPLSGK